ncbi:MAG: TRIC cation channel family protein [Planctomycetia bacterium]|nr:TRIC cation channel family protein [Planctomycetia bacterium]
MFNLTLEIIATIAFAAAGALMAIRKEMDLLGVCILGVISACGGGVIRDCLLGATPPVMFVNPVYATTAIITSVVVFVLVAANSKITETAPFEHALIITDAIGLGLFTIVGVDAAIVAGYVDSWMFAVTLGVLTGVGGGAMRDVLAGETPFIFAREIYASASLVGAALYLATRNYIGEHYSVWIWSAFIAAFRLLAAYRKWNLPKARRYSQEKSE